MGATGSEARKETEQIQEGVASLSAALCNACSFNPTALSSEAYEQHLRPVSPGGEKRKILPIGPHISLVKVSPYWSSFYTVQA